MHVWTHGPFIHFSFNIRVEYSERRTDRRSKRKRKIYIKLKGTKWAYCETRTGLGLGLGPVQNPDLRKTRTRHSDLPSKKTGLVSTKPGLD